MALVPSMEKLRFLPDDKEPVEIWKKCIKAQKDWEKKRLPTSEREAQQLSQYRKEMAIQLVWLTNLLEDTLPKGLSKKKIETMLSDIYDRADDDCGMWQECTAVVEQPGLYYLVQYLRAFKFLCQRSEELHSCSFPELTEELVQRVHETMMLGQKNEQGLDIHAGRYRTSTVCAGSHLFPSPKCITEGMMRIIKEYNDRIYNAHDPFELASWLHFNIVTLHPFEDGNGRLSRLLWCYSLMRDGLPFPAVLTTGHKQSQKHLIQCIEHDRNMLTSNHPHLTTLTVISVAQAWKHYFTTLDN